MDITQRQAILLDTVGEALEKALSLKRPLRTLRSVVFESESDAGIVYVNYRRPGDGVDLKVRARVICDGNHRPDEPHTWTNRDAKVEVDAGTHLFFCAKNDEPLQYNGGEVDR